MDIYVLDENFKRKGTVVDDFISLVWAERFNRYGDFTLQVHSTLMNRTRFIPGTMLTIPSSHYVMVAETFEDKIDAEGRRILEVSGKSLEAVLERRLARGSTDSLTTTPKWVLTGYPKAVAEQMFHDICVEGVLNAGDIIPGIIESNPFALDTIPAPDQEIVYEVEPKTLYEALTTLCDIYRMGFRITRHENPFTHEAELYWNVYMGSYRTTTQSERHPIIFSQDDHNLIDSREVTTYAGYKNTAYVLTPVGMKIVYADDVDPSVAGFERRVLVVRADDIDESDPEVAEGLMIQRGREELAKARRFSGFDGEVGNNALYGYWDYRAYGLGDIVELRARGGTSISQMQVTEQIFVSDDQGDKSFPTLELFSFVEPGAWDLAGAGVVWDDFDTEVWDSM